MGDTTEFTIGSGAKLYLAAIMDLHSRFVVGWALSAVNDRHLTLSALEKALKRRCPDTGLLPRSSNCGRLTPRNQFVHETGSSPIDVNGTSAVTSEALETTAMSAPTRGHRAAAVGADSAA